RIPSATSHYAEIHTSPTRRSSDLIPEGIEATVTRNYGQTANDKAEQLIHKLIFATASVIVLVAVALGWREAIVVGAAVVITLALDRKSTRLNSSHVKSSHAVFCVK